MKYFMMGILLSAILTVLSLSVWGMNMAINITGGIGLLLLILSMIILGSMVSGDRMRANFASESMEERHKRTSVSTRLFLMGLPNLVVSGCLFYYFS
ncbi:hypothetical protein J6TS1_20950 [Siminovitchia terrae]|uniref:DUF5316 domain-containing protein n=1 Tax=Siminovitchia terrae TaxID=1914933 RepID=A0A429X0V3_SIMTE|nr:DUF5316 family protein [Siminovitchia terrae]RST57101.1 hypothetical protein D5F11_024465 [Siminovitchia terrae]GIN96225.1 hypothetical protein J6TS1_20950 [Siminovitchia terrae]